MAAHNLNIIHALRSYDMMAVGALYALGHDDLARRAEAEFPAVQALAAKVAELNAALDHDYPIQGEDMLGWLQGLGSQEGIPTERLREVEEVMGWLDKSRAEVLSIRSEIDAIIDGLYDNATISAEEGMHP